MFRKEYFQSEGEIENLVREFESCSLPPEKFNHREHLAVVALYLKGMTEEEATNRMRAGLHNYLDAHVGDRQKYHEAVTVFWVKLVRERLEAAGRHRPFAEAVNEVVEFCGDSELIFEYYSRELIESGEARLGWVEPDLKQLD